MQVTQDQVIEFVRNRCDFDDFDLEDVEDLVVRSLEWVDAEWMLTFLAWPDDVLGGTPVVLIRQGRVREVSVRIRTLVERRSTCQTERE